MISSNNKRTTINSIIKIEIRIIQLANKRILIFVAIFISRFLKNSSKCFLYNFVPLNQRSIRSDPFIKKKEAINKNTVVGITGTTTPIIPIPTKTNPRTIKINLFSLLVNSIDIIPSLFINVFPLQWLVTFYRTHLPRSMLNRGNSESLHC